MDEKEVRNLLAKVVHYLSFRDRSLSEIAVFLTKKGANASNQETVLNRLAEMGLINDEAFASQVIESKLKRGYGSKKIYFDLLNKGISSQQTKRMLSQIAKEKWVESACFYIRKKHPIKQLNLDQQTRQKIEKTLYSRGFETTTVKSAIDALTSGE